MSDVDGDGVPTLDDGEWLREQIDAGREVADIAAEVGRTPRAVRYALHRHKIETPQVRRRPNETDDDVRNDYRAGVHLDVIAERYGLTLHQVEYRVAGLKRAKPRRRTTSGYGSLNDPAWLRIELALGASIHDLAARLGCDRTAVRAALRRHRITVPASGMTRWERVDALRDPSERAIAARRIEVEATAEALRATADAQRAMRVRVRAQRAARRADRPVGR